MKPEQIPNLICIVRIVLVVPIVWGLLAGAYTLALGLIAVAGASDVLDGYLARRFDWRSWIGGLLDPAADKLLLVSVFVSLTWLGLVPLWFTTIVVGRDVVIIGGTLAYHLRVEPVHGEPTQVSKLNTIFLVLYVVLTLAHARWDWPPSGALWGLAGLVLVTIAVSMAQYVVTGVRRAGAARHAE